MTLFERKCVQILAFHKAATESDLLDRMNPEQATRITAFVDAYERFTAPDQAMRDYRLALVPFQATFDQSRQLLKSLYALFEAWSPLAGNTAAVQAETGAWLLGANPDEDIDRLEARHPIFVKHFGAAGLPPALKAEAVKKQVADHRKAAKEKPAMPIGRKRSELEADQRALDVEGTEVWRLFHDFLDGYFGKSGDEAYSKKAEFAYDRRTLARPRKKAAPVVEAVEVSVEKPPVSTPPFITLPSPGPVASGTAHLVGAPKLEASASTAEEEVTPDARPNAEKA